MKKSKVTIWDLIYTIPYHQDHNTHKVYVEQVCEDLEIHDKFQLNSNQYQEFKSFCIELGEMINGIYEKFGGELSGMNGAEDTDEIVEELKLNPEKLVLFFDENGKVQINTYFYETN